MDKLNNQIQKFQIALGDLKTKIPNSQKISQNRIFFWIIKTTINNSLFSLYFQFFIKSKNQQAKKYYNETSRNFLINARLELSVLNLNFPKKKKDIKLGGNNFSCFNFIQILPKFDKNFFYKTISTVNYDILNKNIKTKTSLRYSLIEIGKNIILINLKLFKLEILQKCIYFFDLKKILLISNGLIIMRCLTNFSCCFRNSYFRYTWISYLKASLIRLNIILNHFDFVIFYIKKNGQYKKTTIFIKHFDTFLTKLMAFGGKFFSKITRNCIDFFEIFSSKNKIPLKVTFKVRFKPKIFKNIKFKKSNRVYLKIFNGFNHGCLIFKLIDNNKNVKFSNLGPNTKKSLKKKKNCLQLFTKESFDFLHELTGSLFLCQFEKFLRESFVDNWLNPMFIYCTKQNAGFIEIIPNSKSFHKIKSKNIFLKKVETKYIKLFEKNFLRKNESYIFSESISGYSLICFLLQIKDRHNGNILLSEEGRLIHIDFGFIFDSSPGNINLEAYSFKMSDYFLLKLGGIKSEPFENLREIFVRGLLVTRKNIGKFIKILRYLFEERGIKNKNLNSIFKFQKRFFIKAKDEEIIKYSLDLFKESIENWKTKQYDNYQKFASGIK